MKYIKKYELYNNKLSYYWKTSLKRPHFILALKKIQVPEKIIKLYDDIFVDDG